MEEKKVYRSPVIENEIIFNVEAFGDVSILSRCWGLTSPNPDGTYSHASGGCKD